MVKTVRDRLTDIGGDWEDRKPRTNIGNDLVLGPTVCSQRHFDFGRVDAFRMFIELGTAGATTDLLDLGNLHDQPFGDQTDPVALGKRDTGIEEHVDRQRSLVEGRQEGPWQLRCKQSAATTPASTVVIRIFGWPKDQSSRRRLRV